MAASNSTAVPERALQHGRAHFGEEQRDAETDRHADQQRDSGRHERAVDRRQRAEILRDRDSRRR